MAITVGGLLEEGSTRLRATGSESARLDAELLLGQVLGLERTSVLAYPTSPVGDGQTATFRELLDRRATGEPVAYIRGVREFHGLALAVDPRVLIPRPETELVVDLALDAVRTRLASAPRAESTPPLRVWDVATGSGAVAVALAVALRRGRFLEHATVLMSDVSPDALAVAIENAVAHAVADRVTAALGDLLRVEPSPALPVDVLTANLPYVPSDQVATLPVATRFEPVLALDGGPDGLDLVRRLLDGLPAVLAPGGVALLEIGGDQDETALAAAAERLPGWSTRVHPDLSGSPRVLVAEAPGVWAPSR